MMIDDNWWQLMTIDDNWWQLTIIDDNGWQLMMIDDNWWLFMVDFTFWSHMHWWTMLFVKSPSQLKQKQKTNRTFFFLHILHIGPPVYSIVQCLTWRSWSQRFRGEAVAVVGAYAVLELLGGVTTELLELYYLNYLSP